MLKSRMLDTRHC